MSNIHIFKTGFSLIFFSVLISACGSGTSHLPSPLEFPGMVVSSVIENVSYNARRKQLEAHVSKNYFSIRQDVMSGGGHSLDAAFNVAGIKGNKRVKAKRDFISGEKQIFRSSLLVEDALIDVFATLYLGKSMPEDKTINGFDYLEARKVIRVFADQNFEALRLDIKQGNGQVVDQLVSKLHIDDNQKRRQFIKNSQTLYKRIYLEPVVVALMVHR